MFSATMELIPSEVDEKLILDVGCAKGYWGYEIKTKRIGTPIVLGLDLWVPYIQDTKMYMRSFAHIYHDLVLADGRQVPFRDRVFDIVLASDLLEHLTREDGLLLLRELERVGRNRIIASTPSRPIAQGALEGNPFQRHLSSWKEEDLAKRGYEVKTVYIESKSVFEAATKIAKSVFRISKPLGMILAWKDQK